MEWENIGVGGNSAFLSVKKMNFNLAGEFVVEIRSKFDHLGRFETCRDFRYQVVKRAKSRSESSRNVGATGHFEKTGCPFLKVACSLTFLDDFGLLFARFETCRIPNMEGAPLPSPLGWVGGRL